MGRSAHAHWLSTVTAVWAVAAGGYAASPSFGAAGDVVRTYDWGPTRL